MQQWIPDSFEAFTDAVAKKRVRLQILPESYLRLFKEVLSHSFSWYDKSYSP